MFYTKSKRIIGLAILLVVAGVALASNPAAAMQKNPELPSPACDKIQAPAGTVLAFHAYAIGVQVYRWSGTGWVLVEPVAKLYAEPGFQGLVGDHTAGPTWESNSGSFVKARRLEGCNVDPTAIDWLLLEATSSEGPGIFDRVTHIQRVNTVGGRAPAASGSPVGATVEVPYTAEYYFYRAE